MSVLGKDRLLGFLIAALLCALPSTAFCANATLSDDYGRIMEWLTDQMAQGLGFNAGSTFDPPTEMRAWRMQPDISFGVGVFPFDKSVFPAIQNESLAQNDPGGMLPDKVLIPDLVLHARLGLPARMDLGVRFANMTTPDNYKLSPTTKGSGQSNTIGVGLRKHFYGGRDPLLTVTLAYNHNFGSFNFYNRYSNIELTQGVTADSTNNGQLEWDVRSFGANMVVSQSFGKWVPYFGGGFNRLFGSVRGRLESVWDTPLISPSSGEASHRPEISNGRLIAGIQRTGSFFQLFMNGEIKAYGVNAGKAYIVTAGLAAPFRIGANSSLVRQGRNQATPAAKAPASRREPLDGGLFKVRQPRGKTVKKDGAVKSDQELIFIR